MRRALLVLLPFLGSALAAQESPLVGSWHLSFPGGMRIENGYATPLMATGVLIVEAQGDSLIGTLARDSSPGLPARPPARLAGKTGSDQTTFISQTTAKVNLNGEVREATSVSTWILEARGDSLVGTVQRRVQGVDVDDPGPLRVAGSRAKS
jgi:hypothetical protein